MNLTPIGDRIVVKADPVSTMTESGLYVPEKTRQNERKGTSLSGVIVAVGPEVKEEAIREGVRCWFRTYKSSGLDPDEDPWVVVREEYVDGVEE